MHALALAPSGFEEFLEISVSDGGIGIGRDDMARLFQPFSQIDSSLSRKFEGTGLGLAMVRRLAELHGGSVAVASEVGEGSRFAAWLPLREAAGATTMADRQPALAGAGRLALVIDADDRDAHLVRLLLETEGFTVLHAASYEAAIAMAGRHALSLIALDLQTPAADGWAPLLDARDDGAFAGIPVVVIASASDGDALRARGVAALLRKPISRGEFKALLADLALQPVQGRTYTVLVVDDDPKAIEVIAAFLPAPAYVVVRAYGGSEAIALAQRLHPDLILLDLMMPGISGFDVVSALRRSPETARIPILVVTARDITPEDRALLARDGDTAIHVVGKSGFSNAAFMDEVRRALSSA